MKKQLNRVKSEETYEFIMIGTLVIDPDPA